MAERTQSPRQDQIARVFKLLPFGNPGVHPPSCPPTSSPSFGSRTCVCVCVGVLKSRGLPDKPVERNEDLDVCPPPLDFSLAGHLMKVLRGCTAGLFKLGVSHFALGAGDRGRLVSIMGTSPHGPWGSLLYKVRFLAPWCVSRLSSGPLLEVSGLVRPREAPSLSRVPGTYLYFYSSQEWYEIQILSSSVFIRRPYKKRGHPMSEGESLTKIMASGLFIWKFSNTYERMTMSYFCTHHPSSIGLLVTNPVSSLLTPQHAFHYFEANL